MGSPALGSDSADIASVEAVHCLVHPGFDAGEHPEFERDILRHIDIISQRTHDVLLIISDGERHDETELNQFRLLDTIEGINIYISLAKIIVRERPSKGEYWERYGKFFLDEGLDQRFLEWCMEHVDMSDLLIHEEAWGNLQEKYFAGHFRENMEEHDRQATALNEAGKKLRREFDVLGYAQGALKDLAVFPSPRRHTARAVRNKGRFHRIFQHAIGRMGSERVAELFIADAEDPRMVNILPVTYYKNSDGLYESTNHKLEPSRLTPEGSIFNQSEPEEFGNAASERDSVTYELSVTRNRKLEARQVDTVLDDMGYRITLDTAFYFFGEYRDRCVRNVASIVHARLEGIAGDVFFIDTDRLTLQREDDRAKASK